jgi:ketosteroid isomerase-like protein
MSQQNVEIVRRLIEARHPGMTPTSEFPDPEIVELLDPDIEVDAALGGDLDGNYRGLGELAEMLQAFWGEFEDARTEIEECLPAGDHVVLGVRFYGRGKSSGVKIDWPAWHVWTLRDGKAVHWRLVRTRREALEAVGLSDRDVPATPS